MPETSEITIEAFDGNGMVANEVADLHLAIRFQQRKDGENKFRTDIYESQRDLRGMQRYYVEPGGNFFIARDTQAANIAGFIGLKRTSSEEGQIKRMSVMPDYRRQGIGTRLAETAVAWARDVGMKKLNLTTGVDENARYIYEAVGFVWVADIPEHEDIAMELDLVA